MHSQRSFKLAMIGLVFFVVAFLCLFTKYELLVYVAGLLIIVIAILSSLGFISSLRGFKEKHTIKKWIGFVINLLFLIGFTIIFISNILDIQRAFN